MLCRGGEKVCLSVWFCKRYESHPALCHTGKERCLTRLTAALLLLPVPQCAVSHRSELVEKAGNAYNMDGKVKK